MTSVEVEAEPTGALEPSTLAQLLVSDPPERRQALRKRMDTFLVTVGSRPTGGDTDESLSALEAVLAGSGPEEAWLALAVIAARLPTVSEVRRLHRAARLGEALPALFDFVSQVSSDDCDTPEVWPEVEVISDCVVVDLNHTASNVVATGIQRVAREVGRRWDRDHEMVAIGWAKGYRSFRRLPPDERLIALEGKTEQAGSDDRFYDEAWEDAKRRRDPGSDKGNEPDTTPALVPWRCTHLVPELPAEIPRAHRYRGFVEFSRSRTGIIGHDCVPITATETTTEAMAYAFTSYLCAAASADRIAATSTSSATEYAGWRDMLVGSGQPGPEIRIVGLAVEARPSSEESLQEARRLLSIGSLPIVLAVGSHEPRKNHLALLQAAELVWRDGVDFTLTFVGGNSWASERFEARVAELQEAGRPLQVIRALSDGLLWAAYRVAYCTVFPSLHEGFGLPVGESLACGTPVITSSYGSMAELSAHGGALLADPRDDQDLARALKRLLSDPSLRERLAGEAAAAPVRSWDDYARDTWSYLVEEPLAPRSRPAG